MSELPSGTVTFLFTDIEGSTQHLKTLGRDYDEALAEHERILEEAFAAHGGRVVDTQGDSFFAVFPRAGDAISAATDAQRSLAGHAWPRGADVRVRMGLHSGEPRAKGERYVGFGVHRAARIGAVGHGGQILVSNATRELVHDDLPPDVVLRDLGEYQLKDIDRPERLYQVEAAGLLDGFAQLKAQKVEPPRRVLRTRVVVPLAGLVIAAVVGVIVLTGGGSSVPPIAPNTLVKIDEGSGEVVDVVEVGADPGQVDVVGDHVFVTGQEDATLSRVPLGSGEVTTSGRFDTTGSIAGDGESTLWAVSKGSDEVTQIEAESLSPLEAVPIPDVHTLLQAFVEVGGGSVWVAEFAPPVVKRWDAFTLQLQRTYRLDESEFPLQIGFGDGAAWVALSVTKALLRIDAKDGRAAELEVGNVPRDPVVAFGSVWAAMGGDGTVWRIDPRSGRARAIIKVGKGPWGVAAGKDAVWVTSHCEGTVSRIDPDTDEVVERIELGFFPQWLAVGGGHVWVGVAGGQGAQGLFLEECL